MNAGVRVRPATMTFLEALARHDLVRHLVLPSASLA